MKKILLSLALFLSANFVFANDIMLDAPSIHLGYFEAANGLPFNHTLSFIRTTETPKVVDLVFSYTQIEMICADRIPDGGGYGGGYYGLNCGNDCYDNSCPGCHNKSAGVNKHSGYDYGYGHGYGYGYDRNFMGICRRWTTMETQKSGRVKLVFKKKAPHNDGGDMINLNIFQRDLHSTVFWVKGWAPDSDGYYKVINLDRTVIFK